MSSETGSSRLRLLQQCDLPCVVELVLDDAAEQVEEVVMGLILARDLFLQARIGERSNRLHQLVMRMLRVFDCLLPRSFAGIFYRRKVLCVARLYCPASDPLHSHTIPGGNVKNEFPDAVRILDRMCGCTLGIDAFEDFDDRVAVPGLSIKSTADLVSKSGSFGHSAPFAVLGFTTKYIS